MKGTTPRTTIFSNNLHTAKTNNHDYENDFISLKPCDIKSYKDSINNSITSSTTSSVSSSTHTNYSSTSNSPHEINHNHLPYTSLISLSTTPKQPIHLRQFNPVPEITITMTPSYENVPNSINEFTPITPEKQIQNQQDFSFEQTENGLKSSDIMIYLNLKETSNTLDFSNGFKNFIATHYMENANNYNEQIRAFNYFRESTIRLSFEPGNDSIHRLFEYFNSLCLAEKRFFQFSQCTFVHFSWFDCINGVESTQKSIQFEKASILFNIAALYTQLASIFSDGPIGINNSNGKEENESKLEDQFIYWLKAAGCINYLNANFSNSPSLDMSAFSLYFFVDIFMTQVITI